MASPTFSLMAIFYHFKEALGMIGEGVKEIKSPVQLLGKVSIILLWGQCN